MPSLLLGALLFALSAAAAGREHVEKLAGYWMSSVEHDAGAVVLRFDEPPAAVFRAARAARWESAEVSEAHGAVELRLQGGGTISLRRSGERLVGVAATGARSYPVAFARSSLTAIHAWLAENPAPAARARQGSVVELVYVAAADCVHCRRWEGSYLEQGRPKAALDWDHVRFSLVDIGSFRARFGVEQMPAHLKPAIARLMEEAGQPTLRGTPWFALFVNGELRCHAFGTTAFETLVQPSLRAALREKARAAGT